MIILFNSAYRVSVFLAAMLTSMICYRLVRHGLLIKRNLAHGYASTYVAIVVLVVESMLPYAPTCVGFLISLRIGSQMVGAFGYVHARMMVRVFIPG